MVVLPQVYSIPVFAQATPALEQDLEALREEGERLYEQSQEYKSNSQYQEAVVVLEQSLAIYRQLADRAAEAKVLISLSFAHFYLSNYQKTFDYAEQSLIIRQSLEDDRGIAHSLSGLGFAYLAWGQFTEALQVFNEALTIAQELEDRQLEHQLLNNLGSLHHDMGDFAHAAYYAEQALAIAREIGDRQGESADIGNLGSAYYYLGDYQQAVDHISQAILIAREVGNTRRESAFLAGLGSFSITFGQYLQAIEYLEPALKVARDVGHVRQEAACLFGLGEAYDGLEEYEIAINYYSQAISIFHDLEIPKMEALTRIGLGQTLHKLGNYDRALEQYELALEIDQQIADLEGQAYALVNIGETQAALVQYGQALETYQQALLAFNESGIKAGQSRTLGNIGSLLAVQDQPELAIAFLKSAVELQEDIRTKLQGLSTEVQQSYVNVVADDYRLLADLLLRENRVLEAQQVLDLLKVQELDDYLRDVRGNEQTAEGVDYLPPEQDLLALYDQAIPQGVELAQLREIPPADRTPAQQERLADLVAIQQELSLSFDDFLDRPDVQELVSQLTRTARRQNLDLDYLTAIQDNLRNLDQQAVLLYPLILEDRLELILVTPYAPPIRRTVDVSREDLNQAIIEFRQMLADPFDRNTQPAQRLYDWLIAPLAADLDAAQAETLIYAPDGTLRYIPLAALHNGQHWLVEDFRITHITAASLTDFDTAPQPELTVLAGAFSEGEAEFLVAEREFHYSGLPFAGVEVETIAQTIPATTALVDEAFSPTATIPLMDDHTVVHLATHAAFVSGQPEESFIVFGNGERVTLRDMATWSLPHVDLVVLSACRTAVGGELGNGEEILGFGYQIQRTGARGAMASLWSVNDGGTQVLMNAFYAALQQDNTSAESLQRAQRALISGDYSGLGAPPNPQRAAYLKHPYYWAPFILIGNGL
jgi:CHAT domain-containing protein/tetratricopeptide (TPR) repeat protein